METINFDSTTLLDLKDFVDGTTGPYLSIILPARSDVTHPSSDLADAWERVRSDHADRWPASALEQVDRMLGEAGHAGGESIALIVPTEGKPHVEHLAGGPDEPRVLEGPLPALAPIIEHRQRTIAHIVVECDKAGADITGFDGGATIATESVDGDEEHIHRGHPGGWSQRRFQQRAENTWESNISDVADATERVAEQIDAKLIAVAGPTRAQSMLVTELGKRSRGDITVGLEAGNTDGIADEVVTLTDDVHARSITQISGEFRERSARDAATTGTHNVMEALAAGRVETLLVTDDWSDDSTLRHEIDGLPESPRALDAAIVATLDSGGAVVVVPHLASLDDSLGALLRW
ncbi:baeRF2 domain-containing protein [Ilumatobacter coccineus]|jgi:Bacterial archaeo-eukaryotic release factor family 2|uniref:eRF1 domain-containing protein n=1 Tax=Ilumatobacter coccineus (strain NBRC 103263 / KCTC 29153 / YM16-304) TaxID=1313172 RepID=A0A6C7DYF8_ILUCY|nr:Vms1/Ankzf1 family peptidyl-tRNA hydrolase [Ilumatobacter coccineus]BAN00357.1 hypothetical protein YM304_00430 [Ilumatobacter coccineus YM16-304]